MTFEFVGDPFLLYAQRSWSLDDGSPIHFERGFLRPAGPGIVELLLAHPIGITEVAVGTVDEGLIELSSSAVSLAPTASPVTELRRRIQGRGDELSFELQMATEGVELGGTSAPSSRAPEADASAAARARPTRPGRGGSIRSRARGPHAPRKRLPGRNTLKEAPPPSRSSTHALPPWSSAKRETTARPIPTPGECSGAPAP